MKKILLVEDDLQLLRMYQIAFEHAGIELVTAVDGIEALEKLESESPDLMLLDIVMPKMNGVEVLRKIKEGKKKTAPIIMLSVLHQDKDIDECLSLGASAFLVKTDVSPDEVVENIKKRLKIN